MYVESREKFSWFDFFARAAVVVVFVFLLMWIVPLPSVKKVEVKVDKLEDQVNVIVDRIFYDNLVNMKEAAREYFTIPKLPKKTDESVKLTLGEMLDKKLLLSVKDKDGKECSNSDSYVLVKRLKDEYEVKVYLRCGEVSDYIITYMDLECNLACDNNCKLVDNNGGKNYTTYKLYQYKKNITTSGWTKWSDWTTKVEKADDTRTKVQVKGKKWVSNLVYEYEHTKTTKEDDKEIITKEDDKVVDVWVDGVVKTCEKTERVPYTTTVEYTEIENQCDKVAVGTKTVRDCSTCALKTVTVYEKVCKDVEVVREKEVTRHRNETVLYDCSTPGYFTKKTITGKTTTTVIPGKTNTVTVWTTNAKEDGYVSTGNKRVKEDKGYYVYTEEFLDKLPDGYTKTETRTLYSYRNKTKTTKTIYKWDKNPNLGDGWVLTGKVQTKKVEVK